MDEVDSGMHWPLENKTDQAWMSKFKSTHTDSVYSRPSHTIQSTFSSHQPRISEISFSPIFMSNHTSVTTSSNKASCTKWNDVDLATETSPDVLSTCDSNCQAFIASGHCTEPDLKSRCSNNVVHKTENLQETNNPMQGKPQHEFLMDDTKVFKIQVKTQAHKTSSETTKDDVDNPKVVVIKASELHFLLRAGLEKYLLIDCRSFLEYNTCHVQQAINVCCSKIVKRRLQQDKVHIRDLLMQTRDIDVHEYVDVIVYDQCTQNPNRLTEDNFLTILLKKLSSIFQTVALVKGGFLAFQAMYPSLCESKTNSYRCAALTSLSQPCLPVTNVGPTRILPFLYLGSQQDALSPDIIQVNEITYVLNVSTSCMKHPYISDGHFLRIPVNDNYSAKLTPYFEQAFQFLDKVRESNGCCLVHCLAGISRSPTLAIAYIMKTLNMSSDDAYRYVKDKRPTISPNFNFLGQLLEYEKQLKFHNNNKNNNNSSSSRIDSPEVKLSETNGNQVINKLSAQGLELAPSCSSYTNVGGLLAWGDWTQNSQGSLQTCVINTDTFVKSQNLAEDKCFSDTGLKVNVKHHKSLKCTSKDTGLDIQSSPFPVLKSSSRLRPSALNLGLEPEMTRKVPASLNIMRNIGMVLSKSLTDIKEASETLSPVMTTMHECTVSTSYSSYQSQNVDTVLSPFPCGASTIENHISNNEGSSSTELTTAQSQNNSFHSNFMVVTNSSKSANETSSLVESKSFTNSVTSDTSDNFSGHLLKSGEMRSLRSSLSLSLSPVLPSAQCSILEASSSNSVASSTSTMTCAPSAYKIDQKLSEQHPSLDKTCTTLNIPTFFPSHSTLSFSSTSSLTTSHVVKLKSFNLVSSLPFNLSAQSPTSGLARLNFGSSDNDDNVETISMDIGEFNPHSSVTSNFRPSDKPANESLEKLNSFPSTSLDKLNFTPCFSSSIENVHSLTISLRTSGVKRPLNNEIVQMKQSDVTSPTDSSSSSIVISPTNGTEQKQMVHKRDGRAKRTLVRPNSIAFSKYPTFDLGSDCQESPPSSRSSSASQDDSSNAYAQNGKKKKPSEYVSDVKFRLGHYSEREVYRQITAAMEAAMMKSQAFEASRKTRSLDNILSSDDDSSAPNCESSHFDHVLRNFAMNRDKFSSPPLLLEKHACGKNVVDHYNSNSSLSSSSSHTSVHGSMELIQVS